jgi:hypothetical protein
MKKNTVLVLSFMLILFLFFSGFLVKAVTLSVGTNKNIYAASDSTINISGSVDIKTGEYLPIKNITVNISGATNKVCVFKVDGTAIGSCTNITIRAVTNYNYTNIATGNGLWGNDSGTGYAFGYGYGYGYKYGVSGELNYTISWRVPGTGALDGSYNVSLSIAASGNGTTHVFSSSKSAFLIDKTSPSPSIFTPSEGSVYRYGTTISFAGIDGENYPSTRRWTSSINGLLDSSSAFDTSSLSAGRHIINFTVTDTAGQRGSELINLTVAGGLFGNEGNMTTTYSDINLTINGSSNLSTIYTGFQTVSIMNSSDPIVIFDFDFDNCTMNISNAVINDTSNSTIGSILVKEINLSCSGTTKSIYMRRVNSSLDGVCIKDAEVSSISEISNECDESDETPVECDGTEQDGYTCTYNNATDKYAITGLEHSAVKQIDYTKPVSGGHLIRITSSTAATEPAEENAVPQKQVQKKTQQAKKTEQANKELPAKVPEEDKAAQLLVPLSLSWLTIIIICILVVVAQKMDEKRKKGDLEKESKK